MDWLLNISSVLGVFAIVFAAGAAFQRLTTLATKIHRLEEGAEKQGERIGALETKTTVIERETSRPYVTGFPPMPKRKIPPPGVPEAIDPADSSDE